jgi:hypothetical protein
MHPWSMRAEGEVVRFPTELVEDEHERLFKAL